MFAMPTDIFNEPAADPKTLRNLGPLAPLAGVWVGEQGVDVHPVAEGSAEQAFIERFELQPIDFQTNGPQLFYGLRYHTRITKPGEVAIFHEQVGFWLWEPASGTVMITIAIPRGQVAMAAGNAKVDSKNFTLRAERGSETLGILSNPFLDYAFQTTAFEMTVSINDRESVLDLQQWAIAVRAAVPLVVGSRIRLGSSPGEAPAPERTQTRRWPVRTKPNVGEHPGGISQAWDFAPNEPNFWSARFGANEANFG